MITASPTTHLQKRQLWALPTPSTTTSTSDICRNFTLPPGGSLVVNSSATVFFTSNVVYQPPCSGSPAFINSADNGTAPIDGSRNPFYTSLTPLVYVVALTTAMAWLLLITLLMFQPSYHGLSTRPMVQAWRRGDGVLSLFTSRSSPFPLGNRPWLQRFAALMVVIALTTVTADTFRHAQDQYDNGYSDAQQLRNQVSGSLEVRVIRVISDLFLWLAQIQTMIRLFPRRKEKLVIKWVGFLLILLDIIFSCLNSFLIDTTDGDNRPRRYRDAVPALSYLFQLALNLLYAAWVLYFAMTKRRYAFYHHLMPEICIIAFICLLSIVIPVVFFLVDILESDVSAWGDYFRWVGSAAASIVVWEWVERIEFLEREEKKDGILGREIFEEDDFDDESTPRDSRRESLNPTEKEIGLDRGYQSLKSRYNKLGSAMRRYTTAGQKEAQEDAEKADRENASSGPRARRRPGTHSKRDQSNKPKRLSVPLPAASSLDRQEAHSPSSTIYAVHYHPTTQTPPLAIGQTPPRSGTAVRDDGAQNPRSQGSTDTQRAHKKRTIGDHAILPSWPWSVAAFRKSRQSPPVEVKKAMATDPKVKSPAESHPRKFASVLGGLPFRGENTRTEAPAVRRPPTVIPPPARGTPWTPDSIRAAQRDGAGDSQAGDEAMDDSGIGLTQAPGTTQTDTHDFAAVDQAAGRSNTVSPGGNLSGTTALNQSDPSDDSQRSSAQDSRLAEESEASPPHTDEQRGK